MSGQLRCRTKLHGIITEDGMIEIACNSDRCGWRKGLVVLHYFDPSSLELKDTKIFRGPPTPSVNKEKMKT